MDFVVASDALQPVLVSAILSEYTPPPAQSEALWDWAAEAQDYAPQL